MHQLGELERLEELTLYPLVGSQSEFSIQETLNILDSLVSAKDSSFKGLRRFKMMIGSSSAATGYLSEDDKKTLFKKYVGILKSNRFEKLTLVLRCLQDKDKVGLGEMLFRTI